MTDIGPEPNIKTLRIFKEKLKFAIDRYGSEKHVRGGNT
jgi:hypothetical protein